MGLPSGHAVRLFRVAGARGAVRNTLAGALALFAGLPGARAQERAQNADSAPPTPGGDAELQLPPALDARADDVSFDARQKELLLRGHVRVDSPPFYLTSEQLEVQRTRFGAEVKGEGSVAFCPCLGTPLAIGFDGATVAPPADLFIENPTLRVYGVPVMWLPYFWLRSPSRAGLLPPDIQYRGHDGLLLGGGVHLPWTRGDAEHGIEIRGAGYTVGGGAADVQSRTATTLTHVRWERVKGDDGVTVDARGGIATRDGGGGQTTAAWQLDALRGPRGVLSTSDLDAAARPFDRATAETAWYGGPFTLSTGIRAVAVRGGSALAVGGAAGPTASARASGALGGAGDFDATIDGGLLRGDGLAALSFARAEAGTMLATRFGALGASLGVRGAGDIADDGAHRGRDGAASARMELALPFVRAYESSDPADPIRHRLEPRVAGGVLAAHDDGVLGTVPGRGAALVDGAAWFAEGTLASAVGRWGARAGNEMEASLGAVGDDRRAQPAVRWRDATTSRWVGTTVDLAAVLPGGGASGEAILARSRLGPTDGVHVAALLAMRDGVDPVRARVLTDAPLEPSSGLLAQTGWTGGARLAVPWTRSVLTSFGADGDLSARELLAARAALELRDRCGCLVLRAMGAHRLGRPGVDVGVTLDIK